MRQTNYEHFGEQPFFRDDEQTPSRIPIRNASEARTAGRPRRQDAGGEAGTE
ncbi:hypothetical protein Pan258_30360 [Symmachiella dynata]|nr:hypothetical protein Pan258_30360 [Symmachiella dynata]